MELVELGTILEIVKGKKPVTQSDVQADGFLPYVDIEAFETGTIKHYTNGAKCTPCEDGNILIVCDGSRSGLVGRAVKGYVGSTLAKIRAEGLNDKYLYHFVQGKYTLLNTMKKGTGTPHLNPEVLKQQKLIVPSLPEQARIVARIEELFSELDNGVQTLQTIKQQLAVYRQAVLKEAFDGKQYIPLGTITESRLGKMLDKEKNQGIPRKYLRNVNVRWFSFDLSDISEMNVEDEEIEKYTIRDGDLVICEGGEPGRCAVWSSSDAICYQKALHRVRFTDGSNPRLYMYYLWFASATGRLKPFFTGTGIKHLTGQSLVKVPVPTLNRDAQEALLSEIESRLSVCDSIEKTVDTALAQAEAMRQSILKKAFEGGLA